MEHKWNDSDRGKPEKSLCPSATLSTTNPSWTVASSNQSLHGEKPASVVHEFAFWARRQVSSHWRHINLLLFSTVDGSRFIPVTIVSVYRLDDRVYIPGRDKGFFL
jgi:hypothetical protein